MNSEEVRNQEGNQFIDLGFDNYVVPKNICLIRAVPVSPAYFKDGKRYGAFIEIETRLGSMAKLHEVDLKGASEKAKSLWKLANQYFNKKGELVLGDRLIPIDPLTYVDPFSVRFIQAMKYGTVFEDKISKRKYKAYLDIELRSTVIKINVMDFSIAQKLANTIYVLGNKRAKVSTGVNVDGLPMPGDADYVYPEQPSRRFG